MTVAPPYGIHRTTDGRFSVRLSPHERSVLVSLPAQVRALAQAGDASTARLFPPAYLDDIDSEAEYVALTRSDLMEGYSSSLDAFRQTVDSEVLNEDQALAWMRALNAVRLVIGTKLDVKDDEAYPDPETVAADDVRGQGMLLYGYLTWLQGELIEAVSGPDAGVDGSPSADPPP